MKLFEKKPFDPYYWFPKYCKYDGKILLGYKDINSTFFNEKTGIKTNQVRYKRYCEDWQTNRQLHTEYYDQRYYDEPVEQQANG
jgi:muramoyltetrapeptide carboxypeptidase LdcA involved in peptidoglycan recycling